MSLPKTLRRAQEKLDEVEGLMQLHADEVVSALTSESRYHGAYSEEMIRTYVEADRASSNAEVQFFNYEEDFEKMLGKEKRPEDIVEA